MSKVRTYKTKSSVTFAVAIAFAFLQGSVGVCGGPVAVAALAISNSLECKDLLLTQKNPGGGTPKYRFFADTIKQEGRISRTELRTAENKMTYLKALLEEKNLSFIDPEFFDLENQNESQNPKNLKVLQLLESFDFEAPKASKNLLQLLRDLREIAKKTTHWKDRVYALKNTLTGPSRKILLQEATDLVLTQESIERYLKEKLNSPAQSPLRAQISSFIHGTVSLGKPILFTSLASWFMQFPIWTHRSHSLETLSAETLKNPGSLRTKRKLWVDYTTDKLRRMTIVALILFKSAGFLLEFDGNFADLARAAWTDPITAGGIARAYVTYDAEEPAMDPTSLARTMNTPTYARWEAQYEQEFHTKPDPENNEVVLFMWLSELKNQTKSKSN